MGSVKPLPPGAGVAQCVGGLQVEHGAGKFAFGEQLTERRRIAEFAPDLVREGGAEGIQGLG